MILNFILFVFELLVMVCDELGLVYIFEKVSFKYFIDLILFKLVENY